MQVWTFAKEISDFINTAKSVFDVVLNDKIIKFSVLCQVTEIPFTLLST